MSFTLAEWDLKSLLQRWLVRINKVMFVQSTTQSADQGFLLSCGLLTVLCVSFRSPAPSGNFWFHNTTNSAFNNVDIICY